MAFNSSLSYTSGPWTVTSLTTDTITTAKSLPIADLDFANDYSIASKEADKGILINTTSSDLATSERISYYRNPVKDVYTGWDVLAGYRLPEKAGVRAHAGADILIKCVNSNGTVALVPIRAYSVIQVPTAPFITDEVVRYAMSRGVAALFDTGKITSSRITDTIKGVMIPD